MAALPMPKINRTKIIPSKVVFASAGNTPPGVKSSLPATTHVPTIANRKNATEVPSKIPRYVRPPFFAPSVPE